MNIDVVLEAAGARAGDRPDGTAPTTARARAARRAQAAEATSWPFLFHLARVPYVILVLVGLGLLLPEQMPDMLAAITRPVEFRPLLALAASLAFLAFMCWYWARAVVAAHFELPDDRDWSDLLEERLRRPRGGACLHPLRVMAYGPIFVAFLLGLGLWLRGRSWLVCGVAVVVLGLLFGFVIMRRWKLLRGWCVRQPGPDEVDEGPEERADRWPTRLWRVVAGRFSRLIHFAPIGPRWAVGSLVLSLGLLAASTTASLFPAPPPGDWRNLLWTHFLGASPVLLGCGLMVAPLSVLVFCVDGWRRPWSWRVFGGRIGLRSCPTLTILVLASLLLPLAFEPHQVRITGDKPPSRQTLAEHWAKWQETCPGKTPIIVSISGGASRAGLWGAAVLARVDAYARERNAAVYAVSSVSGGSLGAAAYLSALAGSSEGAPPGTRCGLPTGSDDDFKAFAMHLGRSDAIGALLAGYVFSDVPRAFAGLPAAGVGLDLRGGDRAAAIERAFEANASDAAGLVAGKLKTIGFAEPFMAVTGSGRPLWIANGTERDTGSRTITVPVLSEQAAGGAGVPAKAEGSRRVGSREQKADWPFLGASDVIAQLCRDVPVSTAINNTARFPFLEPAGVLRAPAGCGTSGVDHPVSVIDGGYFDNSGLESALELASWLEATAGVRPIVVATSGDGDSTLEPERTVRCGSDTIDPGLPRPQKRVVEVLGPVFGLYNVRSGHVDVLLRRAAGRYCGGAAERRFFHFYLPARGRESVPLNWVLSQRMAEFVWDAVVGDGANDVPGLSRADRRRFGAYLERNRREADELERLLEQL